ncbi:beta-lactamase class A [Syntrophus gentianae]|uniref:beta-lactamase n=1 Tax=Syntrophus gentianae TaxID=43775 RepID=A0A1H7VZG4_9BACT|nr:class A beta-lactamase [Syntrophus gentianae]SEM14636.1 beta-lactamase class A [Syntrophus gentianae]
MIRRKLLIFFVCLIPLFPYVVSCSVATSTGKPPANSSPAVIQSVPLKPKQVQTQIREATGREASELQKTTVIEPPAKEAPRPAAVPAPSPNPKPDRALLRLEGEIKRLAAMAGGTVGVSALHIESGQLFSFHGGVRFPMASAYKIPIAVQLLRRVDQGEIRLNSIVTLTSHDIHPGSGKLIKTFKKKEANYSVRELLELMLLVSDNSASDAILKLAGGPEAVTRAMKDLGIEDITVSRSTLNMLADWRGISKLPAPEAFCLEKYNRLRDTVPADALEKAQNRFYTDLRDTATPDAMTSLLAMIYDGTVLQPETTSVLLKIMERCQTGNSRIKGLMPPGMTVANKTGTIGPGMVNDVAILTLPEGAGHVALTIFIKISNRSVARQELAMAQMARYLYDYYFFQSEDLFGAAANDTCSASDPPCSR